MPLTDVELLIGAAELPGDVRSFLREADRRVRRFRRDCRVPGFVPCDYARAYAALRALEAARLAPGNLFCEWGSGFGVVACLAALLDFEVRGIEIEPELVDAAQELADDFGLPVEFVQGSFLPPAFVSDGDFAWLTTDGPDGHEQLGLDPDDFDVIFAYPWPDEEGLTGRLFERCAGNGAVLLTYHGCEDFRARRKASVRRQRA